MAPCINRSFNSVAIVIYILLAVLCRRANGGLTLFINRRIGENVLGLSVTNDIFLIRNGEPNSAFHNKALFKEYLRPLSADVQRVEMNWFAVKNLVRYSLAVTSSNLRMFRPRISPIPSQGLVKVEQSKTFEINLVCSGLVDGSANVKFVLNYTNYKGEELDRSSKRTLEFTVAKLCEKGNESSTETTPKTKTSVNRTIIVTVCAVLACVICLLVGVVFFWRFVRRMRKKFFNFDDDMERFTPLSHVSCQSADTLDSNSQVPTVVYSPNRANCFRNTVFTKIAKRQERMHECCSSSQTDSDDRVSCFTTPASEPLSVNSTNISREQFAGLDRRAFCAQARFGEDDVFFPNQSDKVALIPNENSPNSKLTLARDSDSKNDMFSTLNDYWALQLGDSLRSRQEFDIRSDVIGEGAFAKVFRGKLVRINTRTGQEKRGGSVDIAVKVCQDDVEFEQMVLFVNEAILMKGFNHDNLLNLLGVILQPASPPLILTPYLSHGDLHKFLRNSRGIGSRRQLIGSRQLVNFATQISRGMEYLSGKKVVHRDLAARNCFVDEDLNVKIGDFGLARNVNQFDLHKMEHPTHLAIKWLALESLLYYIFSEKSDIWSFGIVLWELVTLGSQPYAGLDNCEVTPYLETGKRLSRPLRCPDDLYAIMYSCWLASPEERPTFSVLVHKLEDYEVRLRHTCIAFEFDEDTIEMNDDCEFF